MSKLNPNAVAFAFKPAPAPALEANELVPELDEEDLMNMEEMDAALDAEVVAEEEADVVDWLGYSDDEDEADPSPPAPKQCRYGLACHGRKSGMCPHIHPESTPAPRRK